MITSSYKVFVYLVIFPHRVSEKLKSTDGKDYIHKNSKRINDTYDSHPKNELESVCKNVGDSLTSKSYE